jgi:hypothetical protein
MLWLGLALGVMDFAVAPDPRQIFANGGVTVGVVPFFWYIVGDDGNYLGISTSIQYSGATLKNNC